MTEWQYIKWFDEVRAQDVPQVGGKGAGLGELVSCGFDVPEGFCITVEAFKQFIHQGSLYETILDTIGKANVRDIKNLQRTSSIIRRSIDKIPIPSDIEKEIRAAYKTLLQSIAAKKYVAVRSSTTSEDMPETSFAGQHVTCLGVRGENELLRRVKECWSSLWSDRAIAYRKKIGLSESKSYMCVIVQRLVESDAAGVMFTMNPASAETGDIVIEANFGLCESNVRGMVPADRYIVRKDSDEITSKQVNEKTIQVAIDRAGGGGTINAAVSKELSSRPVLTDEEIVELSGLGRRLESHYGTPQDIEWCLADGRFHILQSRPVTGMETTTAILRLLAKETESLAKEAGGRETVWSNMFFAELLPAPTPLSFDFAGKMSRGIYRTYESLGFGKFYAKKLPIRLICGRSYFNVNDIALISVASGLPIENRILEQLSGDPTDIDMNKIYSLRRFGFGDILRIPLYLARGARILWKVYQAIRNYDEEYQKNILPFYLRFLNEIKRDDLTGLSDYELVEHLRKLFEHATCDPRMWWELGNLMSFITYGQLEWVVKRWYSDGSITPELIKGMSGNKTIETNIELWKLSQQAKSLDASVFDHNAADIERLLGSTEDGQHFLDEVRAFLEMYGHRVCIELELANPRWREDPSFVYDIIRKYLRAGSANPIEQFERQRRKGDELANQIEKAFSAGLLNTFFPVKKWVFRLFLQKARTYAPYRETPKFYFLIELACIRSVVLEMGARLVEGEKLLDAGDVFYFDLLEIESLVRGKMSSQEARVLVRERKRFRKLALSIDLPSVIFSSELDDLGKARETKSASVLDGIPVSAGVAEGPARVVTHPDQLSDLQEGEILVATFIDPSWTSIFLTIKGMVLEVGTVLSHGSIAAREYNLPSVVNVKNATKIIDNGRMVRVDGNLGRVLIVESKKSESFSEA